MLYWKSNTNPDRKAYMIHVLYFPLLIGMNVYIIDRLYGELI